MSTAALAPSSDPRRLIGIVIGITAVIALMLLAFAAPALNSGAKNLPLAVSGPAPAVEQLTGAMEANRPGTFEVTTFPDAEAAAAAIRDRQAIGGIAAGPDGIIIQTASGAGAPYATVLRGIGTQLATTGQTVTYQELAPMPADDPAGTGLAVLGLPLLFGGVASGAALALAYKGSTTTRVLAALGIALLAGFTATAILQFGFGAFDGSYLLISTAVSAGIAVISLTVLGLTAVMGLPGVGLAAVLLLYVSNPLSGLSTGPEWLPAPWGAIGQFLPIGAAGTAIRSAAYFDGRGATLGWVVLTVWAVIGLLLAYLGNRRTAPKPAPVE